MRLTFAGCGDALGSGGRFNTCFHVAWSEGAFLIDCGATALVALKRLDIDLNAIDVIFLSHLHGDHFGGLPGFMLDARLVQKRARPLVVAGPQGTRERLVAAMEALYPRSSASNWGFDFLVAELPAGVERKIAGVSVMPHEVEHFSGAPSLALRLAVDGKTVAYSGDTQWTENLVPAARGADLFICECYMFDKDAKWHLSYRRIMENLARLGPKQLVLTHMGEDMLAKLDQVDRSKAMPAEDGMVLEI